MEPNAIGPFWLVEEKDYRTGEIVFSQSYTDYADAISHYNHIKETNLLNTVSVQKLEKKFLVE